MELTEDEVIKKYGTLCTHCSPNCLLLYEFGNTFNARG